MKYVEFMHRLIRDVISVEPSLLFSAIFFVFVDVMAQGFCYQSCWFRCEHEGNVSGDHQIIILQVDILDSPEEIICVTFGVWFLSGHVAKSTTGTNGKVITTCFQGRVESD